MFFDRFFRRPFPRFRKALATGHYWPTDVLIRHPEIVEYLQSQGLSPAQVDDLLVSAMTGNWDLTSSYICGTGNPPCEGDRLYFLANFLDEHHPGLLARDARLKLAYILEAAGLL
jgi:hypothetical protein